MIRRVDNVGDQRGSSMIEIGKRALWQRFFPDVPLTEPQWINRCDVTCLEEALRIAAERDRCGRFVQRDQVNIGRYVSKIVARLKRRLSRNSDRTTSLSFPVTIQGGYKFTDSDRKRFIAFLSRDGDCLRWSGSRTADGYGRFKVSGEAISAHYVAFFMELGYLPLEGELDGQKFNVSHNCRHRDCCNPRHLKVKSKSANLDERGFQNQNWSPRRNIAPLASPLSA